MSPVERREFEIVIIENRLCLCWIAWEINLSISIYIWKNTR